MGLSWSHILIVLVLFVLLFGRGKISELMGDVAQGIKSFKKGMSDDEEAPAAETKVIEHQGRSPLPSRPPAPKPRASRKRASRSRNPRPPAGPRGPRLKGANVRYRLV